MDRENVVVDVRVPALEAAESRDVADLNDGVGDTGSGGGVLHHALHSGMGLQERGILIRNSKPKSSREFCGKPDFCNGA